MVSDNGSLIPDELLNLAGIEIPVIQVRERQLEEGICFDLGIRSFRFTLGDLRRVVIWYAPYLSTPDNALLKDLHCHLQVSGAVSGVLLLHSQVLYLNQHISTKKGWTNDGHRLNHRFPGDILSFNPEIVDTLQQYLSDLYKMTNRAFLHTFGERDDGVQRLFLLSSLQKTLIIRMGMQHGISVLHPSEETFINRLVNLGTEPPEYMSVGERPVRKDIASDSEMIKAGLKVPLPEELRISWIDPILLTRELGYLLKKVKEKRRKKGQIGAQDDNSTPITASKVFEYTMREISGIYTDLPCVIDPLSGSGELVQWVLRMYDTLPDHPKDRLYQVAENIHCADPSFSNILLTRFGLALQIIDSDFSHPDLIKPFDSKQTSEIMKNVRVGSAIISDTLGDECLSEQERREMIRIMRPISGRWPDIPPDKQALLICCPHYHDHDFRPEVRQYFFRNYSSYSGVSPYDLLVAEYALSKYNYPVFLIIRSKWVSASKSSHFRRWVKKNGRVLVVFEEDYEGQDITSEWSGLFSGDSSHKIGVVTLQETGEIQAFSLPLSELSDTDGWTLKDPKIAELMSLIQKDSIYLEDYCLGAVYNPEQVPILGEEQVFLSFIIKEGRIAVISDKTISPDARAVIIGPDYFLAGVIGSSLMRWYWDRVNTSENSSSLSALHSLPIRQPDWYDPHERTLVDGIADSTRRIMYLNRSRLAARQFHDLTRIDKGIKMSEERRDQAVFELYKIPERLWSKLFE